jgi:quercetin dioxygenase-like cupin family protein
MANLTTYLAKAGDTNGAFSLMEAALLPGNQPPAHVHAQEDELFYVLEGEFDVYAGKEGFNVHTGESVFLPRSVPHAFVIRSRRLRLLTLFAPGGLEGVFYGMSSVAQNLDLPIGAPTYSTADLARTVQLLDERGVRFLTPDEVAEQLPLYPKPLPLT